MIDVRYAVFCDHALVDRAGKLSIIGIFDQINPPQLPFQIPAMNIVVGFEAESADAREFGVRYVISEQDGDVAFERESRLTFPTVAVGAMKRYNDTMTLYGLPLRNAGPHSLVVYVNGEIRKRVVLDVASPAGATP